MNYVRAVGEFLHSITLKIVGQPPTSSRRKLEAKVGPTEFAR